jgi:hypothetical protein
LSIDEPPVFYFAIEIGEICLKNSEVYEIPLISDEYGLYFMDKSL